MRRRRLLTLGAGPLAATGFRPVQDTTGADPLARPDWAGAPRAEVDSADNDATVKAIERRLRCTCGCGLDIFTCRTTDFTCTYSPQLHREVVGLLEAGRGPDEVIDAFVARHGESILMAPRPRGFGAVGYLLPGSVLLLAAALLVWVLVRRQERARVAAAAGQPAPPAPEADPEPAASTVELDRLERALRDLD